MIQAVEATTGPVCQYAAAQWRATDLVNAFRASPAGTDSGQWVRGPLSAILSSLRRVGWEVESPTSHLTHDKSHHLAAAGVARGVEVACSFGAGIPGPTERATAHRWRHKWDP